MSTVTNLYKDLLAIDSVNQQLPVSETFINFKLEDGVPVIYIIGLAFPNYVEAGDSLQPFVIPLNDIETMEKEIGEFLKQREIDFKVGYNEFSFGFDLQIDVPNTSGDFWICRIELENFEGKDVVMGKSYQIGNLMYDECDFASRDSKLNVQGKAKVLRDLGYIVSPIESIVEHDYDNLCKEHVEIFEKINAYREGFMFPLTLSAVKSYVAYRAYVEGTSYLQPDSLTNEEFVRVFADMLDVFENKEQKFFIGYEGTLLDVDMEVTNWPDLPEKPAAQSDDQNELTADEKVDLEMKEFQDLMREEFVDSVWISGIEDEIDQSDLETIYRLKRAIENKQTEKALSLLNDHLATLEILEAESNLCSRLEIMSKL